MVKSKVKWVHKLSFQGESQGHKVMLDATKEVGGQDLGMTPKEMVLVGLCGCTGMDVVSLIEKKFKHPLQACNVSAEAETSKSGHPIVFTKIEVNFHILGEVPSESVVKAVTLSMSQYCSVTAMMSKVCPVTYKIFLNSSEIYTGEAKFTVS